MTAEPWRPLKCPHCAYHASARSWEALLAAGDDHDEYHRVLYLQSTVPLPQTECRNELMH